ncbi:VacJ family lipoprotein [uncultured Ramlibacter sp.]|uniref:MlaA family lipoprotein n=1 Tax=uncultured Ramlibacter sp. TaxID=260755 RepID=UPI002630C93D|nr:VacJ family lipoprotein [uncultured Ramlibacter sp.]
MTTPRYFLSASGRSGLVALGLALLLALGGCASRPNAHPLDPLEPFNRGVMQFNDSVDAVFFKPVATVYRDAVPPLARTGVSNFFGNLSDGWSFVNSLLQFKFQNAAENWMRLNVNTFFGLGGILDIASDLNIERHREDFGQTLGRWGMDTGPYLVLPFFGPSTVRDSFALWVDIQADPVHFFTPVAARNVIYGVRTIDARSNLLRASAVLEEAALDKYSFTRDAFLQRRRAQIFDTQDGERNPGSLAPAAR